MLSLDDHNGKILSAISEAGITDLTLVVLTNDNGGQSLTGAINTPLRGQNGEFYEGGFRVPWAVHWPDKIKANLVMDDPICAIDLLPTSIAVASGIGDPEWKLDGVNLLPR
jgi:arylsulfatase A-like enzyme